MPLGGLNRGGVPFLLMLRSSMMPVIFIYAHIHFDSPTRPAQPPHNQPGLAVAVWAPSGFRPGEGPTSRLVPKQPRPPRPPAYGLGGRPSYMIRGRSCRAVCCLIRLTARRDDKRGAPDFNQTCSNKGRPQAGSAQGELMRPGRARAESADGDAPPAHPRAPTL